jgi:uncharacterized protein (DUF1330 family)
MEEIVMPIKRRRLRSLKTYFAAGCIATAAFAAGFSMARSINAAEKVAPPAYMVVSSKLLKPDAIQAYRDAAGPLANAAGLEILARAPLDQILVLEGEWPSKDGITIEKFRSMKDLKDFWYSDGYQKAKKLREGVAQINFIVAVEGSPVVEK